MPAPRPRHPKPKDAYCPRHARAMPAPRPCHIPRYFENPDPRRIFAHAHARTLARTHVRTAPETRTRRALHPAAPRPPYRWRIKLIPLSTALGVDDCGGGGVAPAWVAVCYEQRETVWGCVGQSGCSPRATSLSRGASADCIPLGKQPRNALAVSRPISLVSWHTRAPLEFIPGMSPATLGCAKCRGRDVVFRGGFAHHHGLNTHVVWTHPCKRSLHRTTTLRINTQWVGVLTGVATYFVNHFILEFGAANATVPLRHVRQLPRRRDVTPADSLCEARPHHASRHDRNIRDRWKV
eukprot:gene4672-biopygen957